MYMGVKIIDAHVHNSRQVDAGYLAGFLERTGTDMACINCVQHSRCVSITPQALALKKLFPGRFYVFTGLDMSEYYLHPDSIGEHFVSFTQRMIAAGCDGIKMLEGKPQMRKMYPVPDFDAECWEPFWAWCEENGVPIMWHVNDPENFWDFEHAPAFAIAQGWLYDDSYVNNEAQYTQVLNVLARHPSLKICFAHFFFMSAQLDRLAGIMEKYKNVRVDLTPGIEMYENFSADLQSTRAFFDKYHDRILYGTDIGGRCVLMGEHKEFDDAENLRRPEIVREFLTGESELEIASDGHFLINRPSFIMRPLALRGERLSAILGENFARFAGAAPRAVSDSAVLEECARLRRLMSTLSAHINGFDPDYSVLDYAESIFGIKQQ
jgi:predicted TIM-barrel fold metal-dependent hydrolase